MRVISGSLRGRKIKGYDIDGTRPTMDRVKESIFGSIQNYIEGSMVLDLFAGSGNLGIEAISNGCSFCYFVDNNRKCVDVIKDNLNEFKIVDKGKVILGDYDIVLDKLCKDNVKFDVIFIDPPYKYKIVNKLMDSMILDKILNDGGIVIFEYSNDDLRKEYDDYLLLKNKKYGDKYISIYRFIKKTID